MEYNNSNNKQDPGIYGGQFPLQMGQPEQQFIPLNNIPWNVSMVPWTGNNVYDRVMEFKGMSAIPSTSKGPDLVKSNLHCKRKSAVLGESIPSKHLITEEKMVAHMSGLHISREYTSHDPNQSSSQRQFRISTDMSNKPSTSSAMVVSSIMSQRELEEKLKNAQSITVCEEVRKLSNDPVIPQILLERMQKPCTALVVWQPPKTLINVYNQVMSNASSSTSNYSNSNNNRPASNTIADDDDALDVEEEEDDDINIFAVDNNNSSNVDLNNCMDLDMM